MTDKLRDELARLMAEAYVTGNTHDWPEWHTDAEAVILYILKREARARAEALERAAMEALRSCPPRFESDLMRLGYLSARNDIAAAIRALKDKP